MVGKIGLAEQIQVRRRWPIFTDPEFTLGFVKHVEKPAIDNRFGMISGISHGKLSTTGGRADHSIPRQLGKGIDQQLFLRTDKE